MNSSKSTPDSEKAAAIILDADGRLLVVRKHGETTWISVGGKQEPGESLVKTLERELVEELGVSKSSITVNPNPFHISPIEPKASQPDQTVRITSFLVNVSEVPSPSNEIAELRWISKNEFESGEFVLGSVLQEYLLPLLVHRALVR